MAINDAATLRSEIQLALMGQTLDLNDTGGNITIDPLITLSKLPCYDPIVHEAGYTIQGVQGNTAATTINDTRIYQENLDGYPPLVVKNLTLNYNPGANNNTAIFRATQGGDMTDPYSLDGLRITGTHSGWANNGNTYVSLSSFKDTNSSPTSNVFFKLNNSTIDIKGQANFNSSTGVGGAAFLQSWNNSGDAKVIGNTFDESGYQSSFHIASMIKNTGGGSQHGTYLINQNTFQRQTTTTSGGAAAAALFRARGNRLENVQANVTGNTFKQGSYLDLYGDVSNIMINLGNIFETIYGTTPTSPNSSPSCGIRFNKTSSSGATLSGTSGISTNVFGNIFRGTGLAIVNNDSTANSIIVISPGGSLVNTVRIGSTATIQNTFNNMYAGSKASDTMNYSTSTTKNWISGDEGNDVISGGSVTDYIIGGVGSDTISTGFGTDTVIYYNPNEGGDTIVAGSGGFSATSDKLAFLSSNFGGITSLTAGTNFFSGNPPTISGTSPLFSYNTSTGVLTYDSNGITAGGDTVIATFAGTPPLTTSNFQFFS